MTKKSEKTKKSKKSEKSKIPPEKIKCPECNKIIDAGLTFCPECGTRIPDFLRFNPNSTIGIL